MFQNLGFLVGVHVQRVVRPLPLCLQYDEGRGEFADRRRELPHRRPLLTRVPGPAVLQCAIRSMPRRAALPADEQVGRRRRQTVEHRVVRRADGATQPRLRRTRPASANVRAVSIKPREFTGACPPGLLGACVLRVDVAADCRRHAGRRATVPGRPRSQEYTTARATEPRDHGTTVPARGWAAWDRYRCGENRAGRRRLQAGPCRRTSIRQSNGLFGFRLTGGARAGSPSPDLLPCLGSVFG